MRVTLIILALAFSGCGVAISAWYTFPMTVGVTFDGRTAGVAPSISTTQPQVKP